MTLDYAAHNEEVRAVWAAYRAGKPVRVPVIVECSPRFLLCDPHYNPDPRGFQKYIEDPETMWTWQLRWEEFKRERIIVDHEMGLPAGAWDIAVDWQNNLDAMQFGCRPEYPDWGPPIVRPHLDERDKWRIFDEGLPDPAGGVMALAARHYLYMQEKARIEVYRGRPVQVSPGALVNSDGVFTAACVVRGVTGFCMDVAADPDYARQLLDFITTATIVRIKYWRKELGLPARAQRMFVADDDIMMLSEPMYRSLVLPFHRRLYGELTDLATPNLLHLCGNAMHLFRTVARELNCDAVDTGFPVDFARLRRELGPAIEIRGGPHVELLLNGTPEEVRAETARILQTGVKEGRFVLRDGNDLAPRTPLANIEAMYEAGKEYGRYE